MKRFVRQFSLPAVSLAIANVMLVPGGTAQARPDGSPGSADYSQVILGDHPIMYWRLGELSGTTAFDSSGNGRDATYVGGPHKGKPGAIVDDPDTSVRFDGTDDYAVWEPGTASYSGPFTVEAWIRPSDDTKVDTFFWTRHPAEFGFDFKLTGTDDRHGKTLYADVGDGTTWLRVHAHVAFAYRVNSWYAVTAVVTTTGITLYVNGKARGTRTYSGTPLLFDANHRVEIGPSTGEWLNGRLDELAVYDYPLSPNQAAVHYAAGINP